MYESLSGSLLVGILYNLLALNSRAKDKWPQKVTLMNTDIMP